ncbi:MAG TPA: multifunctional oxoglutarate decarboxylase/oxoglutarate dehydrogenase thiamine pyrophosphate-binding subunit/dihydrolipoyllysine-residue succinyltransferase subunit [Candidatus Acidoferrales bacterium]|nr:multifunctional oxoglutarate decarboxylase/oxoglutarate dehydrogenase thiamine pyrophosphate-binding subunit/dihydrolipoyllysine-residue succinyltransferase subunit [Candidatus Acidoferrales bacterium]
MPKRTLEVTLPQMGESVTEGVVGSWRKRVGDQVAAGETLVEVQTDKIDAEVPAPESGRLTRILVEEGQTVAVGAGLAEIELGNASNGQAPPEPAPATPDAVAEEKPPAVEAPAAVAEAGVVPVPLPAMGESVTEGIVGSWLKQVGDQINAGETLVEIQTDKVDAEIPSPATGVVTEILVPEGETVAAGTILARISGLVGAAETSRGAGPTAPPEAAAVAQAPAAADVPATPLARRRAALEGVELAAVQGAGPGGLVRGSDVIAGTVAGPAGAETRTEPIKGTRLALVKAMEESLSIPTATSFRTIEVAVLEVRRRQLNSGLATRQPQLKLSYTHLIAFALTWAAREMPVFSTSFTRVGNPSDTLDRSYQRQLEALRQGKRGVAELITAQKRLTLQLEELRQKRARLPGRTEPGSAQVADDDANRTADNSQSADTQLRSLQEQIEKLSDQRKELESNAHRLQTRAEEARTQRDSAGAQRAMDLAADQVEDAGTSVARADGFPQRVVRNGVNLGLAVDVEKKDGSRFLLVPVIKNAERLDFSAFRDRYEAMVGKTRTGGVQVDDLEGATLTLTNPGGVGTMASVPRLMAGQSAIIAVGAIDRPPGLSQLDEQSAKELGVAPVMTLTSTYDHRLVQGVESGMLLRRLEQLLSGADQFYELVAQSLGVELPALPPPAQRSTSLSAPTAPSLPASQELMYAVAAGMSLVKAHRTHGHLAAHLDPLGSEPPGDPALEPETVKLTPELMAAVPAWMMRVMVPGDTLAEALPHMRQTYCGTIAYEIEHISSHEQRVWLRQQIESGVHRSPLAPEQQLQLFHRLAEVDAFERFLRKTYLGQHTFSLEGLDALVPMLEQTISLLAQTGTREVVLGMAHRGRLNVTARIVGRSLGEMIAEFESGAYLGGASTGDVKYHYGAEGSYRTPQGVDVGVVLTHNPSHLEVVDAVVEGRTRALQTSDRGIVASQDTNVAVPVLIHGDAAFTGQGVVTETLNLQGLPGYRVGGTIHIIANNQIGFTTDPLEGRSTRYASDVAKGYDIPIIHVNGDDVEASLDAARLAASFRETFHRDVLIDLIGYRRFGHNEGDEPAYTQPLLMERIRHHPPLVQVYGDLLAERGLRTKEQVEQEQVAAYQEMASAHAETSQQGAALLEAAQPAATMEELTPLPSVPTRVALASLQELDRQLVELPSGFQLNPKLTRQLGQRASAFQEGGRVSWAQAEALALASLLTEGVPIRLTGQDTVRGTFSQRHLMLSDTKSGEPYAPIQHLPQAKALIELYNSPLSEMAALGFEYGYGVTERTALVLWEAQYGDFFNNAQVVVDQFVAAGQAKWNQESRLTLLLPHGYEGSGPEHSSARIERFLELSAEGNLRVVSPTTAAQYFHILRLQALTEERRPLILFTPKSGLRLAAVGSAPRELAEGHFMAVLDDPTADHARVRRLLLSTGKVSWELAARREQLGAATVATSRLELLYPFPTPELEQLLRSYPNLEEVIWVQEEPRNMGAFSFVFPRLRELLPPSVKTRYAGRRQHAAPSEGSMRAHLMEQERLLEQAFAGLAVPAPAEVSS